MMELSENKDHTDINENVTDTSLYQKKGKGTCPDITSTPMME